MIMNAAAQFIVEELVFDDTINHISTLLTIEEEQENVLKDIIQSNKEKTKITDYFEATVPHLSDQEFRARYRLTPQSFEYLLQQLQEHRLLDDITNAEHKKPISASKQLLIYLDYLGHQCGQTELEMLYNVSIGKVNAIIHGMSRRIVPTISSLLIKWPSYQEAITNANNFQRKYGFPNTIGAIDGSYIKISNPNPSYTTRKCNQAITLQALASSNLMFQDIFVGCSSRMHDARIFQYSLLSNYVQDINKMYGMHIIGDGAYPLLNALLVPYTDNGHLTATQKKYNKHHAAARQVIERAFGQLKGRFRRLQYIDQMKIEDICFTITAACALHNLCIMQNEVAFELVGEEDDSDNFDICPNQPPHSAQAKRNEIAEQL